MAGRQHTACTPMRAQCSLLQSNCCKLRCTLQRCNTAALQHCARPSAHLRKLVAAFGQSSTNRSTMMSPLLVSMITLILLRQVLAHLFLEVSTAAGGCWPAEERWRSGRQAAVAAALAAAVAACPGRCALRRCRVLHDTRPQEEIRRTVGCAERDPIIAGARSCQALRTARACQTLITLHIARSLHYLTHARCRQPCARAKAITRLASLGTGLGVQFWAKLCVERMQTFSCTPHGQMAAPQRAIWHHFSARCPCFPSEGRL